MSIQAQPYTGGRAGRLHLVAQNLALDFANTESGRNTTQHLDHLASGSDLIAWAVHAAVLRSDQQETARQMLENHKTLSHDLVKEALVLRQVIYEVNSALANGIRLPTSDSHSLVHIFGKALEKAGLGVENSRRVLTWNITDGLTFAVLGPIATAGFELLTQSDATRIKQCEGKYCGWLFYDTTKNNSRRWCNMRVCGNRSKARALRARQSKEHSVTVENS